MASTPAKVLCTQRSAPRAHLSAHRANDGGSATITSKHIKVWFVTVAGACWKNSASRAGTARFSASSTPGISLSTSTCVGFGLGAFAIASSGSGTGIAAGGGRAGRTRERPRAARRGGYARDASTRRVEGRSSRAGRSARRA
jgi:hypothetical protein